VSLSFTLRSQSIIKHLSVIGIDLSPIPSVSLCVCVRIVYCSKRLCYADRKKSNIRLFLNTVYSVLYILVCVKSVTVMTSSVTVDESPSVAAVIVAALSAVTVL